MKVNRGVLLPLVLALAVAVVAGVLFSSKESTRGIEPTELSVPAGDSGTTPVANSPLDLGTGNAVGTSNGTGERELLGSQVPPGSGTDVSTTAPRLPVPKDAVYVVKGRLSCDADIDWSEAQMSFVPRFVIGIERPGDPAYTGVAATSVHADGSFHIDITGLVGALISYEIAPDEVPDIVDALFVSIKHPWLSSDTIQVSLLPWPPISVVEGKSHFIWDFGDMRVTMASGAFGRVRSDVSPINLAEVKVGLYLITDKSGGLRGVDEGQCDMKGRYALHSKQAGDGVVLASAPELPPGNQRITLVLGHAVSVPDIVLEQGDALEGYAYVREGLPAPAGERIHLRYVPVRDQRSTSIAFGSDLYAVSPQGSFRDLVSTLTDKEGHFRFVGLGRAQYRVFYNGWDTLGGGLVGALGELNWPVVEPPVHDMRLQLLVALLRISAQIDGKPWSAEKDGPMKIMLIRQSDKRVEGSFSITTDGPFSVRVPPSRDYAISVVQAIDGTETTLGSASARSPAAGDIEDVIIDIVGSGKQ